MRPAGGRDEDLVPMSTAPCPYFAPDLATCTDATLGWDFGSTKVTSVYDSRQLSPARRAALVLGPHGRVAG